MEEIYEKILNYLKKVNYKKLSFPIFIVLVLLIQFILLVVIINKIDAKEIKNGEENIEYNQTIDEGDNSEKENQEYIYVDIKGAVKNPGVYKLSNGSIVNDAVKAAGGVSKSANTRFTNLSKTLSNQDVIVIYSNEEIENASKDNIIYIETPCVCEEVKSDACYNNTIEDNDDVSNNSTTDSSESNDNSQETSNKININTATSEELITLSGIGEAKAKSIIEYRTQNGNFKTIEDIKNVSGISETLFNKIKENITV